MDNVLGKLECSNNFEDDIKDMLEKFKLIENGELTFKSYSYETCEYGYYGENYDFEYFDSDNLSGILNLAYKLGVNLVNRKKI